MKVETQPFLPSDAILLTGDRTKAVEANFNQSSGPARSLFVDDKLVACGGLRLNCAESWAIFSAEARERLAKAEFSSETRAVLKTFRATMEQMQRDNELYRLYAEAEVSERFCEALGYKKQSNIFVR